MSDEQVPEKVWISFQGLVGTKFSAMIERITAPEVQPDDDSDIWGQPIAYHRCTCTPEAAPAEELIKQRLDELRQYTSYRFVLVKRELEALLERLSLPTTPDAAIVEKNQEKGDL